MSFERGLLAGVTGQDVSAVDCNTLSVAGTTIAGRASRLGPCHCTPESQQRVASQSAEADLVESADKQTETCSGITFLNSQLHQGMIDGSVHAEGALLQSVVMARHEATDLDLWSGTIELATVCDHPMRLRMDGDSSAACVSCDHPSTVETCVMGKGASFQANACAVLSGKPRSCDPPLPKRTLPPPLEDGPLAGFGERD